MAGTGAEGMRAFHGWRSALVLAEALALLRRSRLTRCFPIMRLCRAPHRPSAPASSCCSPTTRNGPGQGVAARWTTARRSPPGPRARAPAAACTCCGIYPGKVSRLPALCRAAHCVPCNPGPYGRFASLRDFCRAEAIVCLDLTFALQRALDTGGPYADRHPLVAEDTTSWRTR
jgi:hypothetical protein